MKRRFYRNFLYLSLILGLVLPAGCKKKSYRINGTVSNELFWGKQVYLVALDAPVTGNVDSTIIDNGKFFFKGKADSLDARILRVQPQFPEYLEDLVVVLEAGTIRAKLANKSSGSGTPLNNRVQQWKNTKAFYDSIQWSIIQRKNQDEISQNEKDSLTRLSEELNSIFLSDNICTINENAVNGLGLFLFKLYYQHIPANDKNEIISKTGTLYFERDQELKNRLDNNL